MVRALWCSTCTSLVCRECWGIDQRGHQVSCKDDRGGVTTQGKIPKEWRDWWANQSNLLKELVEEKGKGVAIMVNEQGWPVSIVGSTE